MSRERCRACGDLLASDHADVDRVGNVLCYACEQRFGPQPLVARFWHSVHGGWVKLTLHVRVDFTPEPFEGPPEYDDWGHPGAAEYAHERSQDAAREAHDDGSVTLYSYSPNEEGGGTRRCERIWLEGDGYVHREVSIWSRDCDGVTTSETDLTCHVSRLAAREPYRPEPSDGDPADYYCPNPGAKLPDWEERRSQQRDLAAEAMGY